MTVVADTATVPDCLAAPVAANTSPEDVLAVLGSSPAGLDSAIVAERLDRLGPNAVRTHRASALAVLARQLHSAILVLLLITAVVSFFLGERTDAVIISLILTVSVGLGFVNEFRAERATEALHDAVRHTVITVRDGAPRPVDVTKLVPGDVVHLELGEVVPADIRLLSTTELECDESVLTGESMPVQKDPAAVPAECALGDLDSCALMGTVVHGGSAVGVVVATGARAEFGRIAAGLGDRQPETQFQAGLRRFSMLLLQVAVVLTAMIFLTNVLLHRPLIDSLLFSLAIAVGITPQLLPAVVSTSLAAGSRHLARRKVLVKRLVCIEDLGDLDVLVTDKTGTLTDGRITFSGGLDPSGEPSQLPVRLGLQASDVDVDDDTAVGGNPLDIALWQGAPTSARRTGDVRLGSIPFDHERRMTSALVRTPDGTTLLVTKGAPEPVLAACTDVPAAATAALERQFAAGSRVIAVASKIAVGATAPRPEDEQGLTLAGFLVFVDQPKAGVARALHRLAELGIEVKIATGDNARVAQKLCADIGVTSGGSLTGVQIDAMDDDTLAQAAQTATVFARISPEQKARLIRLLRRSGRAVGFLGDGVNDALALHQADVGISVDSAADVAKDAADVVLLEKSLDVLADGISEGRRIFANTIKYVLMGTSSNFGNMFSAAAASAFLRFLPMLPSQILLNNLLYDASQLTIPTDHVDPEQLRAPSHWDIGFIRRFMMLFGPVSSVFDFATFAVMLGPLHAGAELFRSGWFVESLATQTLVIFVIRTHRVPFTRSRPSVPLSLAALAAVACGIALPLSPIASAMGFTPPPWGFYLALSCMVVVYLALIEVTKRAFFAASRHAPPVSRLRGRSHRIHRRAARFSTRSRTPGAGARPT